MAIGKKTGGKSFGPDHPGNMNGRPKLPEEVKAARKYTRGEIEVLIAKYGDMSTDELLAIAKDPKSRVIEAMIASIAAWGIKKGDQARLNFILDRTIGPVPRQIDANVTADIRSTGLESLDKAHQKQILQNMINRLDSDDEKA